MTESFTLTIRPGAGIHLYWRRHRVREAVSRYQIEDYLGGRQPEAPYRATYRLNARGKKVGWNRNVFCFWPKDWTEETRFTRTIEVI